MEAERAFCADRKEGQGGRLGGLTWRHWRFSWTEADLHSPEQAHGHHLPTARAPESAVRSHHQAINAQRDKKVDGPSTAVYHPAHSDK